jgi:hypothetical protein
MKSLKPLAGAFIELKGTPLEVLCMTAHGALFIVAAFLIGHKINYTVAV